MATVKELTNKDGTLSFRIRASYNGKRPTMTWNQPSDMTKTKARKQAVIEAKKFEDKVYSGLNVNKLTFKQLSDIYINDIRDTAKLTTIDGYKTRLKTINKHIGHISIKNLTKQHMRDFINEVQKPKQIKKKDGTIIEKTLSPTTVHDFYKVASTILTYACEKDYIDRNICLGKGIKLPAVEQKDPKVMSKQTAKAYMDLLETAPIKYQAFFTIALYTGLRLGEILALKWSDIDFTNRRITITENQQYIPKTGIIFNTPKTKKSERVLHISDKILNILKTLKTEQNHERLRLGALWKTNPESPNERYCENHDKCNKKCLGYCSKHCKMFRQNERLFTADNGIPMSQSTPRQFIQRLGDKNGLEHIDVHTFRHTAASMLIDSGESVPAVSSYMGHANTKVTMEIYAHSIKESERKLINTIEDYMKKA